MHNLGLFVIQKNKKTMIKEKGKEICQRVLDTNKNKLILDFISEKIYNVNVFIKISFNNQIFDIE